MPVARLIGTEAEIKKYIAKLRAGSDKYDRQATENSIKQFADREKLRQRLVQKLQRKREHPQQCTEK